MNKVLLAAALLAAATVPAFAIPSTPRVTPAATEAPAAEAGGTLRVGTEGAYAPWNFIDESGNLAGYEIDLANALCEQAGLTCEIVQNDWDSIIPNLLAGNYDVIMAGMSITEERLATINFTQDYFPPDPSRYIAAAGADFDFSELSGARIGVQSNTIQAAYAEENFADGNTIVSFATFDQSIADLASGNVDMVLADGSSLDPVVANSGGALVIIGEDVLIGGGVGGGVRKEDTALLETLDAALDALKADGTVDALRAQWFDGAAPAYTE